MTYNTPTAEELAYLASIVNTKRYGANDRDMLYKTYNRIFNTNIRPSSCGGCLAKRHKELMIVYNENKNKENG